MEQQQDLHADEQRAVHGDASVTTVESGSTAGERSVSLRLTDSSDGQLRATYSHIGYYDSAADTMASITLGPLVVYLTGSTGYKFSAFSGNTATFTDVERSDVHGGGVPVERLCE